MENINHHFSAVLAADVAQYSRFMEGDSEATVAALKSCRATFRQCVSAHGGREFGTIGDSLMAGFPSAVEALRAARDCQQHFAQLAPLNDRGDRLSLRIGLHAGDVIDDGKNLFGDIVNAAARLQALAKPGGIVLSDFVHQQVHKEPGFAFRSLGRQPLKNIAEPVMTFEVIESADAARVSLRRAGLILGRHLPSAGAMAGVIVAGLAFIAYVEISVEPRIGGTIEISSELLDPRGIGVLPFEDLSPDENNATVLASGLYNDLLTKLTKIENLRVVSRIKTEEVIATDESLAGLAEKLNVGHLLTGSISRNAHSIRISVQLLKMPGHVVAWAETYDRELNATNLFGTQSDITQEVAAALNIKLSAEDARQLQSRPTVSLEAYEEYVLGVQRQSTRKPADLKRAEQHFRRAIETDPNFALAYVGLADTLHMRRFYDRYFVDDVFEERRAMIEKALEIDPDCAIAYNSLGVLDTELGHYEVAEQSYRKALELDPDDYRIVYRFGQHFYLRRQYEKALAYYEKAIELAPDQPVLRIVHYGALSCLGRYQEALETLMKGIRQHPEFPSFYWRIDEWYAREGAIGEALRWAEASRFVAADDPQTSILFCRRHLALRNYDLAEQCLNHVRDRFGEILVEEYLQVAFARSRFDEARALLENRQEIPSAQAKLLRMRTLPENVGGGRGAPPIGPVAAARYWIALGDTAHAKATLRSAEPTLFDDSGELRRDLTFDLEPPVVVEDLHIEDKVALTYVVAAILYQSGEVDRANQLFDRLLEVLRASRRIERHLDDPGRWVGAINEVPIHAVRQDREMLLDTVRNSLDELTFRWFTQEGPLFDFIRDDPEWIELMHKIDERVARERQYYDEHKDEPLF